MRRPLKSKKNVARYSNLCLAYARRDFASKSRVSLTRNASFKFRGYVGASARPSRPQIDALTPNSCAWGALELNSYAREVLRS